MSGNGSGQPAGRLRVCLVAHAAYGAITGDRHRHVGGAERQASLLARWLAGRGHDVSLVTWAEGQEEESRVDGVRVLTVCRRDQGLRGLRFLHPRWTSLCTALRRADASLYYHNCGAYETGQVALWSRWRGRPFVYWVASDVHCDPRLPTMTALRERFLYRYGLRHADLVLAQTRTQQRMLQDGFGVTSRLIPTPCPGPGAEEFRPREAAPASARVLWVGRLAPEKRPDWLLDVAEACPELGFDLVGPGGGTPYSRDVLARARLVPNVTVHGPASQDELAVLYGRALCLLSTSEYEGLPNTFLEAWSHGLPVVSTVDPDGLIGERGLGGVAAGVSGLAAAIRALRCAPPLWARASANARAYYLGNHTVDAAMARFERVFLDLVAKTPAPSRP